MVRYRGLTIIFYENIFALKELYRETNVKNNIKKPFLIEKAAVTNLTCKRWSFNENMLQFLNAKSPLIYNLTLSLRNHF